MGDLSKSLVGDLDKKRLVTFVPYNGKIADITHADTALHTLDLAAALSETRKILMVILKPLRIAGTGNFWFYPNEGANYFHQITGGNSSCSVIIADGTNRVQYALSVVNDDWDLYCFGYVVEV